LNRFFKISPIIFSLVTLLLLAMPANAQRRTCGADEVLQRQLEENPQMRLELSAAQEAYLNSVADGYSPIRGYARGILGLLKDRVYFPDEYDITDERSNPTVRIATDALKIYPVPASAQLVVTWPALPGSADGQIQVFDLLGRQHLSQAIGAKETN
jgi:hypothetical protein